MKHVVKRYFALHHAALSLGLQAGALSGAVTLTHVLLKPANVDLIVMLLGVFIATLTHTAGLGDNRVRSFKAGVFVTFTAALTTTLGSACGFSLLCTSVGIIVFMPLIGCAAGSGALLASCVLFTADMFVIGSGLPAALPQAVMYGLSFAAGGLLLNLLMFMSTTMRAYATTRALPAARLRLGQIFANHAPYHRFSLLITVAVLIANYISYHFALPQGYWIPMTALLVLKSDIETSHSRIGHRFYGTFWGSLAAALIIIFVTNPVVLALLFVPVITLIVLGSARHYGTYTLFLTIMITMMLNLIHPEGYLVTERRFMDTLVGIAAVVFVLYGIRPLIMTFLKIRR